MSTLTPKFNLIKPDLTDPANITEFNTNWDIIDAQLSKASTDSDTQGTNLTNHLNAKNNPHGVTKAQVGLSNVDNTSDANKPVSTAQANAIADAKKSGTDAQTALNNHLKDKNNPHGITRTSLGLGNVDNTSDANKPVSTAQATAIAAAKKAGTDAQSTIDNHAANTNNPHKVTLAQLGGSATGHKHSASDITTGTLGVGRLPTVPIDRGGTGATTKVEALKNLVFRDVISQVNPLNANDLTETGLYKVAITDSTDPTQYNLPSKYGILIVYSTFENATFTYVVQEFIYATSLGRLHRISADNGATWKSWTRYYTDQYKPTPADINAVSKTGDIIDGDLVPKTKATHSLGTIALPWANVHTNRIRLHGDSQTGVGSYYLGTNGTETTEGSTYLTLGNDIPSGTADNASGKLYVYGAGKGAVVVNAPTLESNVKVTLPNKAGTLETTDHTHTAKDVGAVSVSGDNVMSGDLTIAKDAPLVMLNDTSSNTKAAVQLTGTSTDLVNYKYLDNPSASYRSIRVSNDAYDDGKAASAVQLVERKDGATRYHSLFGTHDKPYGTYNGDGTTSRTIETNGVGNALILWRDDSQLVYLVTPRGAFCGNEGSALTHVVGSKLYFQNGTLYIKQSTDPNVSGVKYHYQVL